MELKNVSYGSDYAMTEQKYIKKYHVTGIYELKFGNMIATVLLSCEQGTYVFENFSFDNKLSKQSPEMIIYNLYLNMLSKKQKKRTFFLWAHIYKKKYGSIEQKVCNRTFYKSKNIRLEKNL